MHAACVFPYERVFKKLEQTKDSINDKYHKSYEILSKIAYSNMERIKRPNLSINNMANSKMSYEPNQKNDSTLHNNSTSKFTIEEYNSIIRKSAPLDEKVRAFYTLFRNKLIEINPNSKSLPMTPTDTDTKFIIGSLVRNDVDLFRRIHKINDGLELIRKGGNPTVHNLLHKAYSENIGIKYKSKGVT
jgi:hypothetical protein